MKENEDCGCYNEYGDFVLCSECWYDCPYRHSEPDSLYRIYRAYDYLGRILGLEYPLFIMKFGDEEWSELRADIEKGRAKQIKNYAKLHNIKLDKPAWVLAKDFGFFRRFRKQVLKEEEMRNLPLEAEKRLNLLENAKITK